MFTFKFHGTEEDNYDHFISKSANLIYSYLQLCRLDMNNSASLVW